MRLIEEHRSTDLFLRLIVMQDDDGDTAIGFDGYPWHTHGDILASLSGLPEKEAIQQYIARIISDDEIIVVARLNGKIRDIWVTDDPMGHFKY